MTDVYKIMRKQDIKRAATKLSVSVEEYVFLRIANKKWCNKCEKWEHEQFFRKNRTNVDGLSYTCKKCEHKYQNIYDKSKRGCYRAYKSDAKRYGVEFRLSFKEFSKFWQRPCSYCGEEIITVGIDKVNPNIGYIMSNCVPCCKVCNKMKSNLPVDDFKAHIQKIHKYLNAEGKDK